MKNTPIISKESEPPQRRKNLLTADYLNSNIEVDKHKSGDSLNANHLVSPRTNHKYSDSDSHKKIYSCLKGGQLIIFIEDY